MTSAREAINTIDRMLADIRNTSITPTSDVVNTLLDLRIALEQIDAQLGANPSAEDALQPV